VEELTDPAVPSGHATFAFRLPDFTQIFRPLRVFAGYSPGAHTAPDARLPIDDCEPGKFDVTDDEWDVVKDCMSQEQLDLKECILKDLPETAEELREFLDREEFGLASINPSYSLSLNDGEFAEKRVVAFQLCPKDEINSIEGEERPVAVYPVRAPPAIDDRLDRPVEEMVPITAPGGGPSGVFQIRIPEIRLPDFSDIFRPRPVVAPQYPTRAEAEAEAEAVAEAEAEAEAAAGARPGGLFGLFHPDGLFGQGGLFGPHGLFPAGGIPVETGISESQPEVDPSECDSGKFEVSKQVYAVASRCRYADNYKQCLAEGVEADDESGVELVEFATDPDYEVVGSSFSQSIASINFETTYKNQISLNRCKKVPQTAEEAPVAPEGSGEVTPEEELAPVAPEDSGELTPGEELAPEETAVVVEEVIPVEEAGGEAAPEEAPETVPEAPEASEAPATVPEAPETVPETPESVPEAPEALPDIAPEPIPDSVAEVPATESEKSAAPTELETLEPQPSVSSSYDGRREEP